MRKEEYIFGIYPVLEAVREGKNIGALYIQKDSKNPRIDEILDGIKERSVTVKQVPAAKLDRMVRSNHQGVVATIAPVSFLSLEELMEDGLKEQEQPVFVILDQISDVRNFGAIIRTAECTGAAGIIIQKKGGAPVTGDTAKASAGALFRVPICKVDHIKDAIFYAQSAGITTVAATEKTDKSVFESDLTGPLAIVMGSEGKGVSRSVLKLVDQQLALPMKGEINSLNVSVACAVVLYEALRQRA